MTSDVVEMTLGVTMWRWLCGQCADARIAAGWTVKRKNVIAWGCDDCEKVRQRAHGYTTPSIDYVPTAPGSFCPPPGWVAPEPIAPWPKPARKGRAQQQPIAEQEAA